MERRRSGIPGMLYHQRLCLQWKQLPVMVACVDSVVGTSL